MSIFLFNNNASSTLASGITNVQTTLTVAAGQGALFPTIAAGQQASVTLEDVSGNIEIVYATGRASDTLTIVRGQEGTTALAFASGSRVEQRITATVLNTFLQKTGGDTLSGTTILTGVLNLGAGGSIQAAGGEMAGVAIRAQPGDTSNQFLLPIASGHGTIAGSVVLTAANIAANMPAGTGLALTNMIVGWAGLSSAIPAGWHLCDGTSGTPDLRDRFIVGGGGALAVTGAYAHVADPISAGTPSITGAALTAANLPPHTHGSVVYVGNTGAVIGPTGTPAGSDYFTSGSGAGVAKTWSTDNGPGTSAALSFVGSPLPAHSHTIESPPYTAVFMIMKL